MVRRLGNVAINGGEDTLAVSYGNAASVTRNPTVIEIDSPEGPEGRHPGRCYSGTAGQRSSAAMTTPKPSVRSSIERVASTAVLTREQIALSRPIPHVVVKIT